MDRNKLYQDLFQSYVNAYPFKSRRECQINVTELWNSFKKEKNFDVSFGEQMRCLKDRYLQSKTNFFTVWKKNAEKKLDSVNDATSSTTESEATVAQVAEEIANLSNSFEELNVSSAGSAKNSDNATSKPKPIQFSTPAQDKLKQEIAMLNDEVVALTKIKNNGLFDDDMQKVLKKKRSLLEVKKAKLNKVTKNMIRKRRARHEYKRKISSICEKFPDVQTELKVCSRLLPII